MPAGSALRDVTMTGHRDGDPDQTEDESRPAAEGKDDDATLRLAAEELAVAKEKVETGRVRVSIRTHEREALIDESLARERIEIETVPVGLRIDAVPEVRQECNTTIVPVVEEVLVVERHLILKEEIRIKRVRTTERHQEKVILRHQEVVVTRHQGDSGSIDTRSADVGQKKPESE
jgi:uncharacterized protein (TIGR02271 family)